MFRYHENQTVVLIANYETVGLQTGNTGIIWALYDTVPPSYEVTFRLGDGTERDLTVSEDEISPFVKEATMLLSQPTLAGVAAS